MTWVSIARREQEFRDAERADLLELRGAQRAAYRDKAFRLAGVALLVLGLATFIFFLVGLFVYGRSPIDWSSLF